VDSVKNRCDAEEKARKERSGNPLRRKSGLFIKSGEAGESSIEIDLLQQGLLLVFFASSVCAEKARLSGEQG